nr:hypothetical protein [uncultured Desulfobacter sp.]
MKKGKKRAELSQALVEASRAAGNNEDVLEGIFEKFYSSPNDENLLEATTESIEQNQEKSTYV